MRIASIGIRLLLPLILGAALAGPAMAGEVLDRVLQSGELRIPNEPGWPPYSFIDAQGTYTGFDVEVAREVARRLQVQLKVVDKPDGSHYTWDEQTAGNWNGAYDAVIGSMTPTAKRDENLDFPVIYYYAIGSLAVHRDNHSIQTPSDASGKRIGVLLGANYEYYVRRQAFGITGMEPVAYLIDNPVVRTYEMESDAFDALAKGDGVELDAVINYLPVIMDLIKQGKPFKVVGKPLYRVPQAVAIEPGDAEFAARLREVVEAMHRDGTLSALSEKWVGFDMTRQ
ncbi:MULTISPECIES: transporter substrate-binding domain-containing protein [unclassified Pseudomonas]|uniref:transporter substrate-binding domain-containing protein n=1 Tax=unclassified Pseudomonas TaxID=196821 RepID=UPI001EDCAAA9|nr:MULTISPECIES: transporter substrate-binding domain-containing protein [unclassified Pseudomonas]MCG4453106.1 transporter substrate-binding domain-containing protein [Pseudomonas sp. MMS21 TM103]